MTKFIQNFFFIAFTLVYLTLFGQLSANEKINEQNSENLNELSFELSFLDQVKMITKAIQTDVGKYAKSPNQREFSIYLSEIGRLRYQSFQGTNGQQ